MATAVGSLLHLPLSARRLATQHQTDVLKCNPRYRESRSQVAIPKVAWD